MARGWRQHLATSGEPGYLLADGDGCARVVEVGRVHRNGVVLVNVVVAYGAEPGPWMKVGTWDFGFSGREPVGDEREGLQRENVADRLRHIAGTAPGPWKPTELHIDGVPHPAYRCASGAHRIAYTTTAPAGRCVFVQSYDLPLPTELVSRSDLSLPGTPCTAG